VPAHPPEPAAPGGAVSDPKPQAPAQPPMVKATTEPATQPTTSPSSATSVPPPPTTPPQPAASSVTPPAPQPSRPSPVPKPPEPEKKEESTSPRRKGKVIKPISQPDDKPHINDLLAKEQATEAESVIVPDVVDAQASAVAMAPPLPPAQVPEIPPAMPEVASTGIESLAEEKNEVNDQIQAFIDNQTDVVEQGTSTTENTNPPAADISL